MYFKILVSLSDLNSKNEVFEACTRQAWFV